MNAAPKTANFSVLIPIYLGTTNDDLRHCLERLVAQSLPANQIVIVQDGPISSDVSKVLSSFYSKLPIERIIYPENRGLGPTLADGLLRCTHEFVARVDSDDRALQDRFQRQIDFLLTHPDISVVGGGLREWYKRRGAEISVIRNVPTTFLEIKKRLKYRNPINHPTVMFRKSHVIKSGNYKDSPFFEDYFLWVRMIQHGYRLANVSDVLVETFADDSYIARRGGLQYVKHELNLVRKFREYHFLSSAEFFIFFARRLPFRILPTSVRLFLYRRLLRGRDDQSNYKHFCS